MQMDSIGSSQIILIWCNGWYVYWFLRFPAESCSSLANFSKTFGSDWVWRCEATGLLTCSTFTGCGWLWYRSMLCLDFSLVDGTPRLQKVLMVPSYLVQIIANLNLCHRALPPNLSDVSRWFKTFHWKRIHSCITTSADRPLQCRQGPAQPGVQGQ